MDELRNLNSSDFSEKFKPIWKSFKTTQSFFILGFGLFLLLMFLNIAKNAIWNFLFIPLFVLVIFWNLYFLFKLKCPKCGWLLFVDIGWSFFCFTGECPRCHAQLKNRILSNEAEKRLRTTIFSVFVIFCVAMVITAYITKQRSPIEINSWGRGHNKELSECLSAPDIISKDLCYWSVALYQKDISICEKIHRDYYQDFCYRDFAVEMKDSSICEKISRSCTKEECYQKVD